LANQLTPAIKVWITGHVPPSADHYFPECVSFPTPIAECIAKITPLLVLALCRTRVEIPGYDCRASLWGEKSQLRQRRDTDPVRQHLNADHVCGGLIAQKMHSDSLPVLLYFSSRFERTNIGLAVFYGFCQEAATYHNSGVKVFGVKEGGQFESGQLCDHQCCAECGSKPISAWPESLGIQHH
jgi:hypothetical protein